MYMIRNEKLEAIIYPELGASIYAFRYNLNGKWVNIMRQTPQEAVKNRDSAEFSSYTLIPYSNRIKNGKLKFRGKEYQLEINSPEEGNTLHGDVKDREWKVLFNTDTKLDLGFNSKDFNDINWPFPFSCKLSFYLEDNLFSIKISIKNEGETEMPAGFGIHPYFSKQLTENDDRVAVKLPIKGLYPGDTPIPTGRWTDIAKDLDFSKGKELDEDKFIDNCFRATKDSVIVKWPGSGVTMNMSFDEVYEHLVFYTPLGKTYFAIEPVTNCNNGFNMAEGGIEDTGTIYLEVGEEISGEIKISVKG